MTGLPGLYLNWLVLLTSSSLARLLRVKHGCNLCFQYAWVHPSKIIIICMEAATLKCGIPYLFLWSVWSNLMEEISFSRILITFIIWSNWRSLPVPFQNRNYFFFIRSIRLSTVYVRTYPRVGACSGHYNNKYLVISVIAYEMLRYIHVRVHAMLWVHSQSPVSLKYMEHACRVAWSPGWVALTSLIRPSDSSWRPMRRRAIAFSVYG